MQHHGYGVPERLYVVLPNVPSAYPDAALRHVVKPGYKLHEGGLAASCAADQAYGLAAPYVKVDILKAAPAAPAAVAEGYAVEIHAAVGYDRLGAGIVGYVRPFVEHLAYALGRGPGDDEHHQHHGKHHKAGEYAHGIGEYAHELAGGHVARHDYVGAQPAGKQYAGVHRGLHER